MAKTKQGTVTPEVMPAVLPEEQLTVGDGQTILTFINGLVPFFRVATQLEEAARNKLATARLFTLPQPGDIDGDAKLQTFIRECSADKKKVEQHWIITSVIFQFQRKLVGARDRVIGDAKKDSRAGYLTEAAEIAQRLHNTFVEDARRRAAVEQQKREAEAAAKAAAERAAETAKLEAEAAEKELASGELSDRERRFVNYVAAMAPDEWQIAAIVAARTANYKDPDKMGPALLQRHKIQAAIKAAVEVAILRRQATAVKDAPLDVQVENVRPDYTRVGVDRTTKSAELLNERLLIEAVLGGQHGIPTDILTVNTTKLNQYARDLGEVINRWPGCRLKTNTKTV